MKKKRIIPVLLLRDGHLVQSKLFTQYKKLGNPLKAVERLAQWDADELIYLNISKSPLGSTQREDLNGQNFQTALEILRAISESATMPITFGGGIEGLQDVQARISGGADKVAVNKLALREPQILKQIAQEFGSQALVVSIDVLEVDSKYFIFSDGKPLMELKLEDFLKKIQDSGAGEILLNCVNRDGMKNGYEIELYQKVESLIHVPLIALGGAGEWGHMIEILSLSNVDAVAAANVFHHFDQSMYLARQALFQAQVRVRPPHLNPDVNVR